ncbi:MAG: hypothetical protein H0U72_00750 [Nitrosospira sp.]|nr:hypothetical protein [Nitrosospira sp.]
MQPTKTKVRLDGRWNLEELSEATKDYTQLYGFAYSLLPDLPTARREEIDYIYESFHGVVVTVQLTFLANCFTKFHQNCGQKLNASSTHRPASLNSQNFFWLLARLQPSSKPSVPPSTTHTKRTARFKREPMSTNFLKSISQKSNSI